MSGFNVVHARIGLNNQPPRSTELGHPSVGKCNEYQPNGSDALWLGS